MSARSPFSPPNPIRSIDNHLLSYADFIASPNFNERPDPHDISLIVLHGISLPEREFGTPYIKQLFCNSLEDSIGPEYLWLKNIQVSAHWVPGEAQQFYISASAEFYGRVYWSIISG